MDCTQKLLQSESFSLKRENLRLNFSSRFIVVDYLNRETFVEAFRKSLGFFSLQHGPLWVLDYFMEWTDNVGGDVIVAFASFLAPKPSILGDAGASWVELRKQYWTCCLPSLPLIVWSLLSCAARHVNHLSMPSIGKYKIILQNPVMTYFCAVTDVFYELQCISEIRHKSKERRCLSACRDTT